MRSRSINQIHYDDDYMINYGQATTYNQKISRQSTNINNNQKKIKVSQKVSNRERNKSIQQTKKKRRNDYEIDYDGKFEESLDLRDQFMQLSNEISELKRELVPLRQLRVDLERELLERDKKFVMFNQIYAPNERQTTFDPIDHFITNDYIQARLEKNTVTNEMKKIRYMTNDSSLKILEENVLKEGLKLQAMRQKSRSLDSEIKYTYDQIEMIKLSAFPQEIEEQKNQIEDLRSKIISHIEYRKKLKRKYAALENMVYPQTAEEIDKTETIQKLLQKYEMVKNSTIIIGFFKYAIRPSEIRKLFQPFGPIEKMESKISYTIIKYRNREDAIHAVMIMNGQMFRKQPLIVRFSTENYSDGNDFDMCQTLVDNDTTIKTNTNQRVRKRQRQTLYSDPDSYFMLNEEESLDEYAQSSLGDEQFENESNSSETKCKLLHDMCQDLERKQTEIERQLSIHSPEEQENNYSTTSSRNTARSNPRRIRNSSSRQSNQNSQVEIENYKIESKNDKENNKKAVIFDDIEMKFDSDVYIQRIIEPPKESRKRTKSKSISSSKLSNENSEPENESINKKSTNIDENMGNKEKNQSNSAEESIHSDSKKHKLNDDAENSQLNEEEKLSSSEKDKVNSSIDDNPKSDHDEAHKEDKTESNQVNNDKDEIISDFDQKENNENPQNHQGNLQSMMYNALDILTNSNQLNKNDNQNNNIDAIPSQDQKVTTNIFQTMLNFDSKVNLDEMKTQEDYVEEEESDDSQSAF